MTTPTPHPLLTSLLQRLDEPAARYHELNLYYRGEQPLAFLSPEAKVALGQRFGRMATNIPKLAVTALAERLRVTGFTGDAAAIWSDWLRYDLDQLSGVAHREALLLGDSYVIVWADTFGRPKVTVESANQVVVQRDPGTRQITAAAKRWTTEATTEAMLYTPDAITHYRANTTGATTVGYTVVETISNPLGVTPVVGLQNSDRILDGYGSSEIDDLKPLVDALNKLLVDLMTTSEFTGRPRRWATGIEVTEEPVLDDNGVPVLVDDEPVMRPVSPIPEGSRALLAESEQAKFGQLEAATLTGYETAVNVVLSQIMACSTLPGHYLGVLHDNPSSADALRAAEASLTARAEARQATFGRAWEQVAKLMVAVSTGRDPQQVGARVQWADAATRSVAQQADAVTKLYAAGLLPASYALSKLGYSDDEIAKINAARSSESSAPQDNSNAA